MRTIKRKYFSKKKGEWVVKEYHYGALQGKRGRILINKKGKINQKNVDKLLVQLKNETTTDWKNGMYGSGIRLDEAINMTEMEVNAYIQTRADEFLVSPERASQLTTSGLRGHLFGEGEVARFIYNLGLDADEVAKEYGVSIDELFNEKNWSSNQFINPRNGFINAPLIFQY